MGGFLQPFGQVDVRAIRTDFQMFLGTDRTKVHHPGVDANGDIEIKFGNVGLHLQCRQDRPFRVIFMSQRRPEESEDTIPDEPVDAPFVAIDDVCNHLKALIDFLDDSFCGKLLGQRGKAGDVGKQGSHQTVFPLDFLFREMHPFGKRLGNEALQLSLHLLESQDRLV